MDARRTTPPRGRPAASPADACAAERERRLRQQLEAVSDAVLAIGALAVGAGAPLQEVLQTIVDRARAVAEAQYAVLGVGTDPARPFEPYAVSGMTPAQMQAIGQLPHPVGVRGLVAREGRVVRVPDVRQHPAFAGWPPGHPEITSFLGVPIFYQGQSAGNLYLANKQGAPEFTEEDQRAVELLATHAGLALQQARLFEAVQTERSRLQTILESAPYGILFFDVVSGRLSANPAAVELFGAPPAAERGPAPYLAQVYHVDGRPYTVEELPSSRALRGETVQGEEQLVRRPDGRQIPLLVGAAPVRAADGRVTGTVVVLQDITPLKELERLREEWTSVIAHDLRQPVTVILGYASLLAREAERLAAALKAPSEHILASARQLHRMIDDLLDVSRLEARRLKLERQTVDLPALVREAVERAAEVTRGHPVRVEVKGAIPLVQADPGRLEQVLGNLLSNAAKYGYPQTEILVEITYQESQVEVSVTNRGPGIPPQELPKLFTRFHRTEAGRQEPVAGLGLGLYISKGLVEAHGGRIWAESTPGQTTSFHFTVPLTPPD